MALHQKVIYLDYHATTPVDPRVFEIMKPYFTEDFGNPASARHPYGWKAEQAVKTARSQVASLIGAQPNEVFFTSGATESIHLAVLGWFLATGHGQSQRTHMLTTATEHKAVLEAFKQAQEWGAEIDVVRVDSQGRVDWEDLQSKTRPETRFLSVIHGNNEIGTLNNIEKLGKYCAERNMIFHVDAAQTFGRVPIDVQTAGIHLLSCSSHKIYGPKGAGALYRRNMQPRIQLKPLFRGGGQECGLRAGTINVPGIVGLGAAAAIAQADLLEEHSRLTELRNHFLNSLRSHLPDLRLNGDPEERLPNNLNLTLPEVATDRLVLGLRTVACSSGSACSTNTAEGSHVLDAIGCTHEQMRTTLRFGLGRFTTREEIDEVVRLILDLYC